MEGVIRIDNAVNADGRSLVERTPPMSVFPQPRSDKPTPVPAASDWATPALPDKESEGLAAAPARSVTLRVLVLGTVLIFINCYWVIEVEGIWHSNHATAMSLFWNT